MQFLQDVKNRAMTYNPVIALLGIYSKDTDVVKRRGTGTPTSIAAMLTIAKLWKEPSCPSEDEWIKILFVYTMEYYSAIRKDKYLPFAST